MDLTEAAILSYACLQVLITTIGAVIAFRTIYQSVQKYAVAGSLSTASVINLWFLTTWKMRSIYMRLFIHIFDYFTDLLVIREWIVSERGNKDIAHVDTKIMAYCSIGILFFYKIVSSVAIFIVTGSKFKSAVLQFFDILLFVEIYKSHKKIITSIMNEYDYNVHGATKHNIERKLTFIS